MRRNPTNKYKDKKQFSRNASKTPKINHPRVIMRGGIRL